MKTPREILIARHRAAGLKLDAIRRAVVSDLNNQETKEQSSDSFLAAWFLRCSKTFWQELILPSRRTWSGLAAVWLLIIAVNVAERDRSHAGTSSAAPAIMSFKEQQKILNELIANRTPVSEADRPKTIVPQPRTELLQWQTV